MSKIKQSSTNFSNKIALSDECPEAYASNIIGGQWTLVICSWLLGGKLRFGELKRNYPTLPNGC
ncbi:winged helix-turn-helix transcriptional regulator [Niabella hibiscisoli]|nr:winged helix-turn-helix transcriptional regulator [Niabella hibiscisoli]MCH5720396.1 winged helix-turn-helix transcriptional regulator [Niabella hibiscisoli]